jgi:hypothetical protein
MNENFSEKYKMKEFDYQKLIDKIVLELNEVGHKRNKRFKDNYYAYISALWDYQVISYNQYMQIRDMVECW